MAHRYLQDLHHVEVYGRIGHTVDVKLRALFHLHTDRQEANNSLALGLALLNLDRGR